ncbi:MAG: MaoC family dehydratase [Dehalococcoidia bacterium]
MPQSLEALSKGYEFPPVAVDLSSGWVRDYTAAVEDEAIGALGADLVPPMALAALSLRALLQGARLPAGAIHLGQEVSFARPVGVGERISAGGRVASRGERRGWVVMGIELTVEDESRAPVMTGRATVTMPLGQGSESQS